MAPERSAGRPEAEETLLVIVGPTAVGKSEMAVELALRLGGEVLTADAMQVYRGLDIGTDKPPPEARRGVPHHLLDLVEPTENFSAALYRVHGRRVLQEVRRRGALPIVCGGTGLYIRAFVDDHLPARAGYHPEVRRHLEQQVQRLGAQALHERLAWLDPRAAARIHPNDARRIVRALEIYQATGTPPSELLEQARRAARPLPAVWVGLTRPREELYRRIHQRVDDQVRRGLVEETRRLLELGVAAGHTAMQALGYKEMARYLRGELAFAEAIEELKHRTRRYARRQWIWFKADPRITWFDLSADPDLPSAASAIEAFVRPRLQRARAGGHGSAYR